MSLPTDCRITRRQPVRCYEFVLLPGSSSPAPAANWAHPPPEGESPLQTSAAFAAPELLHVAPDRWLIPDPTPRLTAQLDICVTGGLGTLIDVQGKWDCVMLCGSGAAQLLATELAVDGLLIDRPCAATSLFGSPVILVRRGDAFDLWIASSYTASCLTLLESLCQR